MLNNITELRKSLYYLCLDTIALIVFLTIPIFSHMLNFPLYLYDPLRFVVFFIILITTNKNALIVALFLPILSTLISGHPVFPKNIIIIIELLSNVLLYNYFLKLKINIFLSVIFSIVISKFIYYFLKYILISFGFLQMELVSTLFSYQLINIVLILIIVFIKSKTTGKFYKFFKLNN